MKKVSFILAAALSMAVLQPAQAQSLRSLGNKVTGALQNEVRKEAQKAREDAKKNAADKAMKEALGPVTPVSFEGKETYYVSLKGSNRNDGRSPETPYKNLQKAIDEAPENAVIKIAAGNYLGTLDVGYIEIKDKYLSLVGGYTEDFSDRDPYKNVTMIRPSAANVSTNGTKALLEVDVRKTENGLVLVDGIAFDLGEENLYASYNPESDRNGSPEGCISGRIQAVGEGLGADGTIGGKTLSHQLIHGVVRGRVIIRNCTFVNGGYYGIQMMNIGSKWEIYNNVFVANSYAACQIDDFTNKGGLTYVNFHHNTVLFSWCRTKIMEDMGFGFRFMSRVDADVHDNIFGCNNYGALEYTHKAPEKDIEAMRRVSVVNNKFFLNKSDILLPSASYLWLFVRCDQFEDVDDLDEVENNVLLNDPAYFAKINQPYLKGFTNIDVFKSESHDPNSAVNTFRSAMGMNMVGTETVRVSMYGNKYPFEEAFNLFGAYDGFGAQYVFDK